MRQEIADLVAITDESAIRLMSRWAREGLLIAGERPRQVASEGRAPEGPRE